MDAIFALVDVPRKTEPWQLPASGGNCQIFLNPKGDKYAMKISNPEAATVEAVRRSKKAKEIDAAEFKKKADAWEKWKGIKPPKKEK